MRSSTRVLAVLLSAALLPTLQVSGQSWCGKNYLANESVVPPGGQFPLPAHSSSPLLAFRCAPAITPYLGEDNQGAVIIDTLLTQSQVAGAVPLDFKLEESSSKASDVHVTITVDGHTLASGAVPLNSSGHLLSFPLTDTVLPPRAEPYTLECTGVISSSTLSSSGQAFKASTNLLRLPDRTDGGSVTKLDGQTGALLVKGKSGAWETIFPLGFYTNFDGYLTTNLSVLNDLADRGINIVHPVPTFDNLTALNEVLDRMEEVGLYLMYDMRFTYMNATSVTEQVNMIKSRKNLLLWYTGDEPDGTSDPLNATSSTRTLINSLDGGGYHPVSLVLNCKDYFFTEYTAGADVVMQDVYPIGINGTFSVVYDTPCTDDFGVCGCDDCVGDFGDITQRMDLFTERLEVLGEARTKTVWAVPQAFGAAQFWARVPTGNEWLVESFISINHGAKGIVPWNDPTTPDIKNAATSLAHALPTIKTFLFDPSVSFASSRESAIDIGIWMSGGQTLVLSSNTQNVSASQSFEISANGGKKITTLLNSGGSISIYGKKATVSLDGLGSLAVVLE